MSFGRCRFKRSPLVESMDFLTDSVGVREEAGLHVGGRAEGRDGCNDRMDENELLWEREVSYSSKGARLGAWLVPF